MNHEHSHESLKHCAADMHHRHSHGQDSRHDHGHHLLQVEGLSVAFDMYDPQAPFFRAKKHRVETIHDLHVSVHAGEIVAVVGASGSGKTLLADAVMGLYEPNVTVSGTVWFDGQRQDAADFQRAAAKVVSARGQSAFLDEVLPLLTVDEEEVYRRGRNAKKPTKSKHASVAEYTRSTGFEAVIGYLYLSGDYARITELLSLIKSEDLQGKAQEKVLKP